VDLMDLSEDIESEANLLSELDDLHLSWEESRESTRTKGKKVIAWGRIRKTAKHTRVKMRPVLRDQVRNPSTPVFLVR
jgi:hypothetical protein